jgi:hypothetical protein
MKIYLERVWCELQAMQLFEVVICAQSLVKCCRDARVVTDFRGDLPFAEQGTRFAKVQATQPV